ncbi:hypothetical protein QBC46DRAFT_230783, partial [Diplogelasinospora grovesii]
SHRSRSAASQRERPTSSRDSSGIIQQLARSILEHSLAHYLGRRQSTNRQRDNSRLRGTAESERAPDNRWQQGNGHRYIPRSDAHDLAAQLLVSVVAFAIRHYVRNQSSACRSTRSEHGRERSPRRPNHRQDGDSGTGEPLLAAALESLNLELQSTLDSIRRVVIRPHSHDSCEAHNVLLGSSERLQRSVTNLQTSVNNTRNLH